MHICEKKKIDKVSRENLDTFWRVTPKSLQMVTAAMKLKDTWSLGEKL